VRLINLNKELLKNLLKEYETKRNQAILDSEHKKNAVLSSCPELQEIEKQITLTSIAMSKNILTSNSKNSISEFETKIEELKNKKTKILEDLKINSTELSPDFDCKLCKDTGFILEDNRNIMCNCLKQKLITVAYQQSNISNSLNDTFSNFNLNLYSDEVNKDIYGANISPRQNAQIIKNISLKFIENFNDPNEKNLIFLGNTGLGKTFLSNCIANELLLQGKTVLYQTSPILLDTLIDYKFSKDNYSSDAYKNIFDVDLLIIDDLGAETLNSTKLSELFTIINTRLLNQNKITKTIISTNLSLKNLYQAYDERIVSRIIGNYNICKFLGEDIRLKR